jgi:predicted transcriptional regulator
MPADVACVLTCGTTCSTQAQGLDMAKATAMTVQVSPEVGETPEVLACEIRRNKAYLAGEAIAEFVERNGWQVARISAALEGARSAQPGILHEWVEKWMGSWDTGHELSRPEVKRYRLDGIDLCTVQPSH